MFSTFDEQTIRDCVPFSCGDEDLDEFFMKDSTNYAKSYPAVLLGRLGVNQEFANQGIGKELMKFILSWFVDKKNKTGCRYMIVDAYNQEKTIQFYIKCGFNFVFSTEEQEKQYALYSQKEQLYTRLMLFDLIDIVGKSNL